MGYMHINNLYKDQRVLLFKEVYALEKIHGTSAYVGWHDGAVRYHGGGIGNPSFTALFDEAVLKAAFELVGHDGVKVHGEAYGGKCQGMSGTYGKELRFVAFDVRVGETWLCVPAAQNVCEKLGLEFVHWEKGPATVEWLDAQRDKDSTQAVRNGMGEGKKGEGIVIRPLIEVTASNGERVMAKHKRAEFGETKTPREVNVENLEILREAQQVADEWVTGMRLEHVLDKLQVPIDMTSTPQVMRAIQEDVKREGAGEIEWTKDVERAVGRVALTLWKQKVTKVGG